MGEIDMSFQDYVDRLIGKILTSIEEEVPEYGGFLPVYDFFDNPDFGTQYKVGKYGLRVYKMPADVVSDPRKRYLEAAAYEPSGYYKATMIVGSGSKQDIMDLLQSDGFPVKLNATYGELLEMFD